MTPHRLSWYVLFVDWEDHVEVRHTATGESWKCPPSEKERLLGYAGFRDLQDQDATWAKREVLVPPHRDAAIVPRPGTEAALAAAVSDWYWRHEVESERSYTWLGTPIVKMPADLFFYQELITDRGYRSVLEIGSGDGGGVEFFADTLHALGGGVVVGVDSAPSAPAQGHRQRSSVVVSIISGDARAQRTRDAVREAHSHYGLIVVDVGSDVPKSVDIAERYLDDLAIGGVMVLEDATGFIGAADQIDDLLVRVRTLGIEVESTRHPFLKCRMGILRNTRAPERFK